MGRPIIRTFSQNLATAGANYTFESPTDYQLNAVLIKFSGSSSDTFTVTYKSSLHANYNTVLKTGSGTTVTNLVITFGPEYHFASNDQLIVTSTNAAEVIAYVTILAEER